MICRRRVPPPSHDAGAIAAPANRVFTKRDIGHALQPSLAGHLRCPSCARFRIVEIGKRGIDPDRQHFGLATDRGGTRIPNRIGLRHKKSREMETISAPSVHDWARPASRWRPMGNLLHSVQSQPVQAPPTDRWGSVRNCSAVPRIALIWTLSRGEYLAVRAIARTRADRVRCSCMEAK